MVSTQAAINFATENTLPEIILATKLYIPQPRPNLMPRPHLIERLNTALTRMPGVILISAPPGFGKTTLLAEWLADLRVGDEKIENRKSKIQNRVAWLSLDEEDNDPRRFLTYCIAALQTIWPEMGQSVLAQRHNTPADTLITGLINEIATITDPFIFVFDDYHVIHNPLIQNSLRFLFNNLPPRMQLVITSRTDLPLPLARLRSRGQLTELGAADLRFTPAEVSTFLNSVMDLTLSPAEVGALERRTEGWIAGLQMAALSMQGVEDTASFVRAFTGSHRYILDYLLEEVLDRQPEPVQQFLLQTSILERMCGPLCDTLVSGFGFQVSGQVDNSKLQTRLSPRGGNLKPVENSQEMLEYLESANLFIIPLDGERRWYRYHHLFADLLRHRLEQQVGTEGLVSLHRRASDWFEQNDMPTEAMSHALAIADVERIVRLAKQKAETMLSRSELVTLLSWLDSLADAPAHSRPRLSLLQAWAMVLTGQLQAVQSHLQQAEREYRSGSSEASDDRESDFLGEIVTLRAAVAYFQRDMPRAIQLYEQALDHLSPDNLFMRGIVWQCLGAAYSWCGQAMQASRAFAQAGTINRQTDNLPVAIIALWNLAQLHVEQGNLQQAEQIYQQTFQLVESQPESTQKELSPQLGRVHIGLAELLYRRNELKSAARYVEEGLTLAKQGHESGTLVGAHLVLAQLKQAQDNLPGALEAVQQANYFAWRYTGPRYLSTQAAICQARLWLAQGKNRAVANWVQKQGLEIDPPAEEIPYLAEDSYLVLVRLLLAQPDGEPELPVDEPWMVADTLLAHIGEAAGDSNRTGRRIETLILQSLVLSAWERTDEALDTLAQALRLAEPEGYIRCFVDEGPALAKLLGQMARKKQVPAYVTKVLAAFNQSSHLPSLQPAELLDPLSEREFEILQLIATGMSNRELADTLVVTVGTVKWHLNNIYSKLAVKSRTQAVARARELGLI